MTEITIGPCRLIHGDCLDVLSSLVGQYEVLVTDPPYGIMNKFGNVTPYGTKTFRRSLQFAWDDCGDAVQQAVQRAVQQVSAAFVFCGFDTIAPIQDAMRQAGLTPKPWVWVKTCPPPPLSGNWWPSAFESAIYAYRSGAWFGDDNPKRCNVYVGDTLRHGMGERGEKTAHPTQKPMPIMMHIVTSIVPPVATCLDCFMGSGTTGVACIRTGRKFIGIEKDEAYFAMAVKRIQRAFDDERTSLLTAADATEPSQPETIFHE